MKTLFRIFNVMFFSAALVFAGFSSVFAVLPTTPPNSTVNWCALCPDGGMWNPYEGRCFNCEEASRGNATYDPTTCTCSCNDPRYVYVPGSSLGCVPSGEWCRFDCTAWGGTWDPLTHSCSGTTKCYGEDQVYDPNTCECACKDGVFNPTTRQCEPDPKLCNGECTAPNVWNDDTRRCELCVSIPGVSYYDPRSCQCRCTQEGYEYDAATGTCVSESSDGPIDWCDYNCKPGEMWNPNINHCEPCINTGPNSDTCTCQCEWWQEYVPGVGCRNSWAWCEFDCTQYNGTWDPVTHSCSGSDKCYGDGQYYDNKTCECACVDGVYNPTTRQCDHEQSFCDAPCEAPQFWDDDARQCEPCVSVPGVSYYDPGSCQCRCVQEGYQYQVNEKNHTVECVPDGGGIGQTCQAGYYWEQKKQMCQPCDGGYYNDTPGAASCTMCPGGRTTSDVGATTCDRICDNADHVASWVATDVCQISTCQSGYTIVNNTCVLAQSVISFDANGGTGGQSTNVTATYGHAMPAISTTAPTRSGYTFTGWYILPSEYTQLEYIESTGTQYIDTGIIPDNTSEFEIECTQTFLSGLIYQSMWGAPRTTSGQNDYQQYYDTEGKVFIRLGKSEVTEPSSASPDLQNVWKMDGTKNIVSFHRNTGILKVNNQEYSGKSCNGTSLGSLTIFSNNIKGWNSDTYQMGAGKIYVFKWWLNSELVLDLIPARRNSDNVLGMYDTVSGTFFTNAGTGAFTAGPEITVETKYYNADGTSAKNWDKNTDTTLYAHWTPNTYTVTLDNQGATTAGTTVYYYQYKTVNPCYYYTSSTSFEQSTCLGSNGYTITKPTRTGYTFGGYYTGTNGTGTQYVDANGGGVNNLYSAVAGNTTLYAKWTANTYTVSFNANGGTGGQTANVTATHGQAMPAISTTAPTRTGYTFDGWYDDATSGTKYYNADGTSAKNWDKTANTTLYAHWTENVAAAEFSLTTTSLAANTVFSFQMSAQGTFVVDWGDGNVETITRTNTTDTTYSHTYTTAGTYTIGMSGQATGYGTGAAISFMNNTKIAGISGSLGAIFGTLSSGTNRQPRFSATFSGCSNLTGSIPSGLFIGVSGAPVDGMFNSTFAECHNLTGSIPAGLFSGISGAPADAMFAETFGGCNNLSGSIPADLFSGISGAPAMDMFAGTFRDCVGLTGSIPAGLFSGISGSPADHMFINTFNGCSNLSGSIPAGLFSGISGAPAEGMFGDTFRDCAGLTGFVPQTLFSRITNTNYSSGPMIGVFDGTGLATVCPAGYYRYDTGFEVDFDDKVACAPCPNGYTSDEDSHEIAQCYTSCTVACSGTAACPANAASCSYNADGNVQSGTLYYGGTCSATAGLCPLVDFTCNTGYTKSGNSCVANTYTISYTLNGGTNYSGAPTSYNVATPTITLGTPTLTGYTFGGWYTSSTFSGSAVTSIPQGSTGDKTFYAKWTANTDTSYKVYHYIKNVGASTYTKHSDDDLTGTSDATVVFDNLKKTITGFTYSEGFAGTAETGTTKPSSGAVTSTTILPDGTRVISLYYTRNTYTVTLTKGTGITFASGGNTYEYGASVTLGAVMSAGYDWSKWTQTSDGATVSTTQAYNFTMGAGNVSYTANATLQTYSISYTLNGGTNYNGAPTSYNVATPTITLGTPTRTGYTFGGWYTSSTFSGNAVTSIPQGSTGTRTFYAKWTPNTYTVTLDNQGATTAGTTVYYYQYKTVNPCYYYTSSTSFEQSTCLGSNGYTIIKPTRTGYTFGGYYTGTNGTGTQYVDANGGGVNNLYSAVAENTTLYAKWTAKTYTVSFNANDGTGGQTANVTATYAQAMPAISTTAPTRTGYTFGGWYDNATSGTKYYNADGTSAKNWDKTANTTLYARWTANTYTVTYSCGTGATGTAPSNGTATYDSNFTPAANNTCAKTGYTFAGWNDGSTDWAAGTAKKWTYTANKTFTAKWTEVEFSITTTSLAAGTEFSFIMSAKGDFVVDWGDGNVETITKPNTTNTTYSHTYANAGTYTIGMSGQATGYNTNTSIAAISFNGNTNIAGISGSLGAIFGTLSSGTQKQPRFFNTFYNCSNLTSSIPAGLFSGISGAPVDYMFYNTFGGCSGLTGSIPESLFAGISGAPAHSMFYMTFFGCKGLTGGIPAGLFSGISGAPAIQMFRSTFNACSGLTGSIPEKLFGEFDGAPANDMFYSTFGGCGGLTGSIPENLFAGISGAPANDMFYNTFGDCSGLTGSIPAGLFAGISGAPASSMFSNTFSGCSGLTGSIPENLFAGISGAPAGLMFNGTFYNCSGLTGSIPENLFAGISGAPASSMFSSTFNACSGLTGSIPADLFSGISGAPVDGMFAYTFYRCSNLTGSIPGNLFAGITNTNYASGPMLGVFNATGLATSCPVGYYKYTTGFEVDFSSKVACTPCPTGYTSGVGATANTGCYLKVDGGQVRDGTSGTTLSTCAAGTYKTAHNEYYGTSYSCDSCADGQYQDETGKTSCKACSSLGGGLYTNSDGARNADTTCYISTKAGKYLAAKTDSTQTTCPAKNYCPSAKLYYPNVNTPITCPATDSTTARTTYPDTYLPSENLTRTVFSQQSWGTGITSKDGCMAFYSFSNNRGSFSVESVKYNSTTGKYDTGGGSQYYTEVNPGYYLSVPFSSTYCNTATNRMLYQKALPCTAGSYCPGYTSVPLCNSGLTYGNDIGITACPSNYQNSAAKSESINSCYLSTSAGKYVAAAGAGQTTCAADGYCTGSVTIYYNGTGGRAACPAVNPYSPAGASDAGACGHKLHLGDNEMYLRSTQKTTPSLKFDFDKDGVADLFGNMSTSSKMMSSGADKSFKVNYGGQVYYIHDDSAQ